MCSILDIKSFEAELFRHKVGVYHGLRSWMARQVTETFCIQGPADHPPQFTPGFGRAASSLSL